MIRMREKEKIEDKNIDENLYNHLLNFSFSKKKLSFYKTIHRIFIIIQNFI